MYVKTDSSKIRDVFLNICARLEAKVGKENLIYPKEIIWMIGPPGAGKSTLAQFLSKQRKLNSEPIVLREICQNVIAKNNGKLQIEEVRIFVFLCHTGNIVIRKNEICDNRKSVDFLVIVLLKIFFFLSSFFFVILEHIFYFFLLFWSTYF